jgi:hypothetical protein
MEAHKLKEGEKGCMQHNLVGGGGGRGHHLGQFGYQVLHTGVAIV